MYDRMKIGGFMDLKEYMFRNDLTTVEIAKALDYSRQQISFVKNGKRVSRRCARDIERYTHGAVSVDEILNKPMQKTA